MDSSIYCAYIILPWRYKILYTQVEPMLAKVRKGKKIPLGLKIDQ